MRDLRHESFTRTRAARAPSTPGSFCPCETRGWRAFSLAARPSRWTFGAFVLASFLKQI